MKDEVTYCRDGCKCMTKTVKGRCGKCGAVKNFKLSETMFIRQGKRNRVIYLDFMNLDRDKHCYCCEKKRKTTSHHLIPIRMHIKNTALRLLRIRVCEECNKPLHPENEKLRENKIIQRQAKTIDKLKKEMKVLRDSQKKTVFFKNLDDRKKELVKLAQIIPDQLSNNPRKIHPALCRVAGRIKEIDMVKKIFTAKYELKEIRHEYEIDR